MKLDEVVKSEIADKAVDFALWVNELESEFGNPILTGLIVYMDKEGKNFNLTSSISGIFVIEATELANRLQKESFAEIKLDLKNKAFGPEEGL